MVDLKNIDALKKIARGEGNDPHDDGEMSRRIPVRFTKRQLAEIDKIVKIEGKSYAGYIRECVMHDLRNRGTI